MGRLFKNNVRKFGVHQNIVLNVLDIINECTMGELYDLAIVRQNESTYEMRFTLDDDVWNDVINDLDNSDFELILKPNNITYLRERRSKIES